MNIQRTQAENLRKRGYSYSMINEKLGISKSTLSYWFKDTSFIPNEAYKKRVSSGPAKIGQIRHQKKIESVQKYTEIGKKEIGELSKRDLWLFGLGLYVGEGSKTQELTRIVNSDPDVIRISILWLTEICKLEKENITIAMHLYPDSNIRDCSQFWIKVTGLNEENFRKTQIDKRKGKLASKRGKSQYGTVHLTVISGGDISKGVELNRRINGWTKGVMSYKNKV